MLDDALDLAAQYRDVARAAEVGGRGPQANEAMLAIDAPGRVESLEADVVEQLTTVHGGGRVRLGQDQQLRLAGARAHIFIYNVVHNAEDYGVITTYLRMQGVMPSSSALDTREGR